MNTLISILMPVRNAMPFLEACLESICKQSYPHWELLVVDDHSTDESSVILEAFAQRDERISVFFNKEKGIIPALRLALKNARGQLVTRMDADDMMKPRKLELLKAALENSGKKSIATGLVTYFSEETLGDGYQKYAKWLNQLSLNENNFKQIYKECVIPSPCWMMYLEDLRSVGAFQGDVYPEDYDLCFRVYQAGFRVVAAKEIIHQWRDYPNRTSRTDKNYADNRFLDLKWDYFNEIDKNPSATLVLWGAGKKGKILAKKMTTPFVWVCNTPSKWGKEIYGTMMNPTSAVPSIPRPAQILITVANPQDQAIIKKQLLRWGLDDNTFWFC